jgi:uncharacterized protein (TIGR00369 family)
MADGLQQAKISVEAFHRLCSEEAPFIKVYGFETLEIGFGTARVRMPASADHIRPGGTISGPAQMALADFTMYAALLGAVGKVPLAVTTNLTINFLNKPLPGALHADGKLIKLGRRLAVGEVKLYSDGQATPVSHVTTTYSIPP